MTVAFSTLGPTRARPVRRLGAASPGGLTLPDASPTASQVYSPRGVWTDGQRIVVADSGNHRLLVWHTFPDRDGAPADVVLGQPDFTSEGPAAGGQDLRRGLYLPTGVIVIGDDLVVADAWPTRVDATLVLGQPDLTTAEEFKDRPQGAHRLRFPYAVACDEDRLVVADTSNNRVLVWHGLPRGGAGLPADTVLARPDLDADGENRWRAVTDDSLCWPYRLSLAGDLLAIADSGNNRVMLWTID